MKSLASISSTKKQKMRSPVQFAIGISLVAASFNLQAAVFNYDAIEAVSDASHGGGHDHALWIRDFVGAGNLRDWNFDGGPGSFVITADGRDRFAQAVRQKLILEIAGGPVEEGPFIRLANRGTR